MTKIDRPQTLTGVGMALTACFIWSFNFVLARAISDMISPVSFAMFRWATASIVLFPFVYRQLGKEKAAFKANWPIVLLVALAGVTFYSPLIYVAGHYSPALNLALIGTTASPVFTFIFARIFLKEKMMIFRVIGLLLCIVGIILLLSKGSLEAVYKFRFSTGDKWMLGAALSFSIYNISVRKKPVSISPLTFLFSSCFIGALSLIPAYLVEIRTAPPVDWSLTLVAIIVYSGAITSVIAFFCWNGAISRIGSSRTSIFTNLIPILASFEAIWFLNESVSFIQLLSMGIVTLGLILATSKR